MSHVLEQLLSNHSRGAREESVRMGNTQALIVGRVSSFTEIQNDLKADHLIKCQRSIEILNVDANLENGLNHVAASLLCVDFCHRARLALCTALTLGR